MSNNRVDHEEDWSVHPFLNGKFWTLPNRESLQTIISNLMKMVESSLNEYKILWGKERLFIMKKKKNAFPKSVFISILL